MRGRNGARAGGDIEALVRERLRGLRPGATPQSGDSADAAPDEEMTVPDSGPGRTVESRSPGRHRDRLALDRGLRWDPGRPGARALCAVAVIAALLAAGIGWWSRPEPASIDPAGAASTAVTGQRGGDGSGGGTDAGTPVTSSPPAQDDIVVSVIGLVRQPGLVTLVEGARVADAIAAAGGALPEADLSTVNLARLLVDGEQIAVGVPGSSLPGGGADPTDPAGVLIDLNTATAASLEELPGIGPVLAERILDFREEHGGFTAVEQLREVSGIGPTVYEGLVDLVTV